ncbi:MAG: A/G-specific adenine glycosylase [Roseitalea sp.]|jgi:A/G-specific adenine glycosylase|nr:A/G-specific adenine glycosylase [Roseitalea sp.]MBO6721973.1 A/G-specific adenine glycosylase [Roseitalea sp.]MBO6743411.1 A/G-specific adenine glycosylase [Roseitalea sp.]
MPSRKSASAQKLLAWYDDHARDLPWRVGPRDRAEGIGPDPYRVWLSEIMLQQTTVAAVRDYFHAFTERWPTIEALAAADEEDILKAWAGLGYYSRARNLKKCADAIMTDHGGAFPADLDALRALPGIGDYTSAAIAAIAFDIAAPVVDGNVERVVTRLKAIDTPLPKAKPAIKAEVAAMLDADRPGDFAQAMMDLGATICTPKRPACLPCPLRSECTALDAGDPERFPVKAPKKDKPLRVGAAFVLVRGDGAVLLEKRAGTGLLAGMTQVPTTRWTARNDGETDTDAAPVDGLTWRKCGQVRHVFTHFALDLTVWRAHSNHGAGDGQWWSPASELGAEALPTVMKKAIACALPDAF